MSNQPGMTPEQAKMLGEVHGIVSMMRQAQADQGKQLSAMDSRLREQETTAARHGAWAGSAVAVGMTLIIEGIKGWTKLKGGGGGGA